MYLIVSVWTVSHLRQSVHELSSVDFGFRLVVRRAEALHH
jgi:hypothetical protein